ncbi:MAG TPA: zinc-ribbon domain-containing protein, partial [Anaeromyxobacter sp.]
MKFTCERCGKKYATAEDPAPGRVYKLRCKACGHLIVVKAAAAAAPGQPPSAPPEPPSIGLEIGTPEPAQIPAPPVPAGRPALGSTAEASAAAMRSQHDLELTPRQGDSGYVDLFADVPDGPANLAQKGEDPFLAAARASLPETHGSAALEASPDPFADLRDDLSAAAPSEPAPRSQPSVPKVPVIPKPEDQGRSVVPLVLIGAGVAVMVGILAFALLSSGRRGPPRAPPPPAVATPAPAAQ